MTYNLKPQSESENESCLVVSNSWWPHGLYSPWNSPGQNNGVGSLSLLQRTFPTQGLSPGLLKCSRILYQLSHKGSPRILEWVAYSFSRGSSQPKNQTRVSCIAGRFFTNWAIREALIAALNMPVNSENSAVATGLEKVSFHPKERQCQRIFKLLHNCTHFTC